MANNNAPILYTTVKGDGYAEYEEKRSTFIGHAIHIESEEEAVAFVKQIKSKHYNARHNVWAYSLKSGAIRYSDDGEPQGTAGVPVLDCIRKAGINDTCVVVTRYFGGILLGAGGLVRAYTKAAASAIENAEVVTYEMYSVMEITCSYSDYQKVSFELSRCGAVVDNVDYADNVKVTFAVKQTEAAALCQRLYDICAGRSEASAISERFGCR